MSVTVNIPEALREYSGDKSEIVVSATTVRGAFLELEKKHNSVYESVCDETGIIRRHINVFVNSEFICARDAAGLDVVLKPGDVLTIWQAVSGG